MPQSYVYLGSNRQFYGARVTVQTVGNVRELRTTSGQKVSELFPGVFTQMVRDGRLAEV